MIKARELKIECDNLQTNMQKKWEFLNSGDKGHYKQKITRFKDEFNKSRTRFRKAEERFNTEDNRNKLNNFKAEGTKEKFDSDVRTKLLTGTEDLYGMDEKLVDIKKQGEETALIMRSANNDIRSQRDIIISVGDKNKNIQNNLVQGKKVISQISRNEFKQRGILYATILILFMTDIVLAVVLISRVFK